MRSTRRISRLRCEPRSPARVRRLQRRCHPTPSVRVRGLRTPVHRTAPFDIDLCPDARIASFVGAFLFAAPCGRRRLCHGAT